MTKKENKIMNEQQTKTCTACGKTLPISEFHKLKTGKYGVHAKCKECHSANAKEYYSTHIDEYSTRNKDWYKANHEKSLLISAKTRAKKRGLEFNLTLEDIVIPEFCPVLGIKLERGVGKLQDNSPSIDRIDNTKGYVKGNVKIISWRANNIKSDSSLEELKKLVEYLENN